MIKKYWPIFLILAIVLLFFYPIFLGKIPFPGDLLVGEYSPYNSNSYFGISPGGVPNKGQGFDVIRMIYPWKEFAVNSIASGALPLWNPHNFSGTPFLANFQSAVFYPFNVLLLLLGNVIGWTFYIILQPILAAIFTFLFLRENKFSKESSLFGSVVFAFSSFLIVWLEYGNLGHALLWLPLVLFLIDKNLKKITPMSSFFLILALTMTILAGYIQITIFLFIFSFSYLLFKCWNARKLIRFLPFFTIPLLLSSIQLLSTYEIFSQSARSIYTKEAISNLLIPVYHMATTFVPDFFGNPTTRNYWLSGTYIERVTYIGVLPLIFIFIALFKKKTKFFWFFFSWTIFIYVLLLSTPLGIFLNSLNIPIIGTGVPTRIMFLYVFSASVLATYGLDSWLKDRKNNLVPVIALGIIYLSLWAFSFSASKFFDYSWIENLNVTKKNLILPTLIFFLSVSTLLLGRRFKKIFVFILLILVFDLFYFFHKITPFSPSVFFYPETSIMKQLNLIQGIDRSWGYGAGYLETNFQTHEKIFSTDGYDPLIIKNYAELVASAKEGKFLEATPRSDVNLPQGIGSLRDNENRKKLLDLLGTKYIVFKDELLGEDLRPNNYLFPTDLYKLKWQKSPWQIYENLSVMPRFFLTEKYVVVKNKEQFAKIFYKEDFDLKTLILSEPPNVKLVKDDSAKVILLSYQPNKIEFETSTKKNQLLFLSDNYFSGWNAFVDGKEAKILKADYSFRAIIVPEGKHKIVLNFLPNSLKYGIMVTGLGALLLTSYLIYAKKNKI